MKKSTIVALALAALGLTAPAAHAVEGRLTGSEIVLVFRNKQATDEAIELVNAGVHRTNPALILWLVSCAPASGTRVVVTSYGFFTHDILVVEGPNTGCRGNVVRESVSINTR